MKALLFGFNIKENRTYPIPLSIGPQTYAPIPERIIPYQEKFQ